MWLLLITIIVAHDGMESGSVHGHSIKHVFASEKSCNDGLNSYMAQNAEVKRKLRIKNHNRRTGHTSERLRNSEWRVISACAYIGVSSD